MPLEGLGGRLRLRLRRLFVVGRGRGFFGGHVCSLVGGRVRCGTGPAALLLLFLSYATVGWGRGSVFRGGWLSAFAVSGRSEAVPVLVLAELGLDLIERVHIVRVRLVLPQGLLELLVELLERMPGRGVVGVAPKLFEERIF